MREWPCDAFCSIPSFTLPLLLRRVFLAISGNELGKSTLQRGPDIVDGRSLYFSRNPRATFVLERHHGKPVAEVFDLRQQRGMIKRRALRGQLERSSNGITVPGKVCVRTTEEQVWYFATHFCALLW